MENIVPLLVPALLAVLLVRLLVQPIQLVFKIGLHAGFGFLCLWLLNSVSGVTGLYLPINGVTVLIAGVFGVPGMGLIALLEMMA